MRRISFVGVLAALLIPLACGGGTRPPSAPAPEVKPAGIAVGDNVASPWHGQDDYFLAVVEAVAGPTATVKFVDDNTTAEKPVAALIPIAPKQWRVGDKVLAVWAGGRFYPGEITEVKPENLFTVKWGDGSEPSDVEAGKIIAPPSGR
jgi:hypothetical protein